jgi:tetraacyldisaccharide 4'-kinase
VERGKTTLTLHLVALARARGIRAAVVAKNYRPGPGGRATRRCSTRAPSETRTLFVGEKKPAPRGRGRRRGCGLVIVDDGFSTWSLARDLDVVLLDAQDLWGGGHLLPRGRMREPRRALQRAGVVVVSRLGRGEDPAPLLADGAPPRAGGAARRALATA